MKSAISKKFPMPDGACLGHYDVDSADCSKCAFKKDCASLKPEDMEGFFPVSDSDVLRFIEEMKRADK